jgi:hypothetical protein
LRASLDQNGNELRIVANGCEGIEVSHQHAKTEDIQIYPKAGFPDFHVRFRIMIAEG